ncbi:TPA: hypothetical protein ACYRSE_005091 [Klebsiella michiganensis]|uniref:Uncharacterized protein n=1 Tax=Klebsiella grimontii TaxID=2058152 RepID=A0A839CEE0_9ENTR|nr:MULTISPECIES: hypothetical protein [Klebsiella]QLX16436.1 hypothetical protein HV230_18655 [Klebsiella oxytoca]AWF54823.1 hypothetical protein CSC12_5595 [Klebsiella michiganensis]EKQ6537231.1 hypothetical protein [Klebsiella michiganensis]ELO7622305.1 hypothetical protein [Klebsiella michiganensis]ELQ7989251.1 hypothetical protein [Klebsiella michiganensis]
MNISTVNELIHSLESAGELSIKETKVMALAKAYQQLAAENVALKNPDNWLSQSDYGYEASEVAAGYGASEDEVLRAGMIAIINRIATPATDRIVAEAEARGVEKFAAEQRGVAERLKKRGGDVVMSSIKFCLESAEEAEVFAQQLREGAK